MYPFKDENSQKAFGFVFSIFGLLILALGITYNIFFEIFALGISYTTFGLLFTMIGLFYFTESIFKG